MVRLRDKREVEQVEVLHLDARRPKTVEPRCSCCKNRARSKSLNAKDARPSEGALMLGSQLSLILHVHVFYLRLSFLVVE